MKRKATASDEPTSAWSVAGEGQVAGSGGRVRWQGQVAGSGGQVWKQGRVAAFGSNKLHGGSP